MSDRERPGPSCCAVALFLAAILMLCAWVTEARDLVAPVTSR
jgi:hypothetical protein